MGQCSTSNSMGMCSKTRIKLQAKQSVTKVTRIKWTVSEAWTKVKWPEVIIWPPVLTMIIEVLR